MLSVREQTIQLILAPVGRRHAAPHWSPPSRTSEKGRIPNWLTLPLWLLGLAKAADAGRRAGFVVAALGVSVLLALPYVALCVLAKGGAGDAKLMAAIGGGSPLTRAWSCSAVSPPPGWFWRFSRWRPRAHQNPLWGLLTWLCLVAAAWSSGTHGWGLLARNDQGRTLEQAGRLTLPYGMAIFIGVCVGAAGVKLWIG